MPPTQLSCIHLHCCSKMNPMVIAPFLVPPPWHQGFLLHQFQSMCRTYEFFYVVFYDFMFHMHVCRSIKREISRPSVNSAHEAAPAYVFVAFSTIPLFSVRDDVMDACVVLIPGLMDTYVLLINFFGFLIDAIAASCCGSTNSASIQCRKGRPKSTRRTAALPFPPPCYVS